MCASRRVTSGEADHITTVWDSDPLDSHTTSFPEPCTSAEAHARHPIHVTTLDDVHRGTNAAAFSSAVPHSLASQPQPCETEQRQVAGYAGDTAPTLAPAGAPPPDNAADTHDGPLEQHSSTFDNLSYVRELPTHLRPLANEIHRLDTEDLVYIADMTDAVATKDVYSLLPYTGSNWFLPSIRDCAPHEPRWELRYSWTEGFIIAMGGRRIAIKLLSIIIRLALLVLTWFMLWNMLPHWLVQPGGYVWDPAVLVVVAALIGGLLCRILRLPPLVGVLWIGIMWNNIPRLHYLTAGIDKHVFDICSKLGLTVILARAGYSITVKGIRPHWKQSLLLATLPFAFEGVAHSLIANRIFPYHNDYDWAFLQGMLCSIASPAVVVPGSLYLQELGYGRGVGPLSLMLSAVGVEIVVGVWCANFIIGLIFYNQKLAVAIVLGPVQFVGGVLIGIALGYVYVSVIEVLKSEAKRLPTGKYERKHFERTLDLGFVIFLVAVFTMVFLGYGVNLAGGGCVMAVFFSATVSHLWSKDAVKELEAQKRYLAHWLAVTWNELMLPLLFATMGAKINVKAIFNADFFPKAIICLVCSTAVRLVVILCVQLGDGMSWREKAVVCVGYLGKASAQASVGPLAANLVAELIAKAPVDERGKYDTMKNYANNVQQMSAMYVMFMAVIASVGLLASGRRWLYRDMPVVTERRRRRAHNTGSTDTHSSTADGGGGGGDNSRSGSCSSSGGGRTPRHSRCTALPRLISAEEEQPGDAVARKSKSGAAPSSVGECREEMNDASVMALLGHSINMSGAEMHRSMHGSDALHVQHSSSMHEDACVVKRPSTSCLT